VKHDDTYINPVVVYLFIIISAILILVNIINEVVVIKEYGFGFWLRFFSCVFMIIVMVLYIRGVEK